ncbi:MAG: Tex-like N-terminal domain-containing protein [Thermoguttaceae bacterium]|nr:Tex-like N-terminal domain-containing protein [Thermoguttaceae bacterium]
MAKQVTIDIRDIAQELNLAVWQIQAVIELLEAGNTIPFITRYRRDRTGGLDEEQLRRIQSRLSSLRLLAERKQTILRSIESQGKLTPELEKAILEADSPSRLEDLYLPYKPKKQTLATLARSRGLEKLAEEILRADPACADLDKRAADFVDPDKKVHHVADALAGAGHIVAEQFSERADLRQRLRQMLRERAFLVATAAEPPRSLQQAAATTAAPRQAGPKGKPVSAPPSAPAPSGDGEVAVQAKDRVAGEPVEQMAGKEPDRSPELVPLASSEGSSSGLAEGKPEPETVAESPAEVPSEAPLGPASATDVAATEQGAEPGPPPCEQHPVGAPPEAQTIGGQMIAERASGQSAGVAMAEEKGATAEPTPPGEALGESSGRVESDLAESEGMGSSAVDPEAGNGNGASGHEDAGNGNGGHLDPDCGDDSDKSESPELSDAGSTPYDPQGSCDFPAVPDPGGQQGSEQPEPSAGPVVPSSSSAGETALPSTTADAPPLPKAEGETTGPIGEASKPPEERLAPPAPEAQPPATFGAGEPAAEEAFSCGIPGFEALAGEAQTAEALAKPALSGETAEESAAPEMPIEPGKLETPAARALSGENALEAPSSADVKAAAPGATSEEAQPVSAAVLPEGEAAPAAQTQAAEPARPKKKRKKRRKERKKAGAEKTAGEAGVAAQATEPQAARPQKLSKAEERWLRSQAAFRDYFNFRQKIDSVVPHQTLALNRGERLGVLRVKFEYDFEPLMEEAEKLCIPPGHPHADFLRGCLRDALLRLVMPALERELRRELTDKAEEHALRVFARNLRKLLLQPPVRNRRVLAIDPGLKNGCTAVALDEFGNVLGYGEFFVIGPPEQLEKGKALLCQLIERYRIDLIAIGNGTGSRRTEPFVAGLLANELKDRNIHYCIVNEAGASLYSTSPIGREEFPDYSPALRSAISIGRRLQDPLSELVKIEPAHLGVGLYQHDIQAAHLRASLEEVVESCVNYVGVDVNTASVALLRYVSGLNQLTARRIYEYRRQNGPFRNRLQLREVPGIGEATFVQAAGFLKILDGDNPLDATWIHPESYPVAEKVLEFLGFKPEDLRHREQVEKLRQAIDKVNPKELSRQLRVGELTLRDILSQLARPGRDPREDLPGPIFRQSVLRLQDLKPGMALQGTVANVVDFGIFVDFGLPVTGLVHISEMSTKYVRDPHELAEVGDIVHVWVRDVDIKRRRVALTMIPPGTTRERVQRPSPAKVVSPPAAAGTAEGERPTQVSRQTRPPKKDQAPKPRRSEAGEAPQKPQEKAPVVQVTERTEVPARPETPRAARPARKRSAPAPPVQLSEEVLAGKQPMRSFAELAQYFRLKRELESKQQKRAAESPPKGRGEQGPAPEESRPAQDVSASPLAEGEAVIPLPIAPIPAAPEPTAAGQATAVPVVPAPTEAAAGLPPEGSAQTPSEGNTVD